MIWLSALPLASRAGSSPLIAWVCRNSRPRLLVAIARGKRDALVDLVLAAADDLVEEAARLARVARDFRHAFLVVVELLEGGHRHVDVVFLEAEQAGGIVHQHVGVEHEELDVGG